MQKYQNNVQTLDGRAIVGASVTVTQFPSGAPATVFNANGSGVITQPILTNGDGEFAFYAANGRYQLQVTGGGISVAQTISDIVLFDRADSGVPPSPSDFGAVGDGVVNDSVEYAEAEATLPTIYLPVEKTYNLDANLPTKHIYGPGALKLSGITFDGANLTFDAYRTSAYYTPDSYSDLIGFPADGSKLTVMISPGANTSGEFNRSTIVGTQGPRAAVNVDRVEGFGNGAMMFTRYGERITAIGTISCQWLGTNDPAGTGHPWWVEAGGFIPGQPGWDFLGMETRNPGIGARIAAFNGWAAAVSDVGRTVGLGRDTFNGSVHLTGCTAVGYRSGAGVYVSENLTCLGSDVFRDGVFHTNSVGAGVFAGNLWQDGTRNAVYGYNAAANVVRGEENVIIGSFAAYDGFTDVNGCVVIGNGAANTLSGTSLENILVIQSDAAVANDPIISGRFVDKVAGINIDPANIKGTLHIRTADFGAAAAAHTNADELVIENSGSSGISIRSGATNSGNIFFARSGATNTGGFVYDHSASQLTMRANGADQFVVGGSGVFKILNLPTVNPGAGTKQLWVDTTDSNRVKFAV